jgi:Ca-activated chloride channel family protein
MPDGANYCARPVVPRIASSEIEEPTTPEETRMPDDCLSAPHPRNEITPRISAHFSSVAALLVLIAAVIALSSWARSQDASPSPHRAGDAYTIKVNVDVVVLRATAQDRKNIPVSGLSQDDFQVYEDGVLQPVKYFSHEDVPVTVGLVVDNSGSMKSKRPDVIAAALAFAHSSNPKDQMFVVNFNEKVSFGLPGSTAFTDQPAQLQAALSRVAPDGETALYDAIAEALEHLKKGNRDKKVLILVSDGGDNASKHKLTEIMTLAGQPGVTIYTVGIFDDQDADRNPSVLKRLAKQTGGEAFLPDSLKDVTPICERIARDIRNQYTIAYVPTNRKRDGTYRSVQVKASESGGKHLSVRTRTGYFAPLAESAKTTRVIDHETHD